MRRERIGSEVAPVPLAGRRARLRPATPADLETLYRLATDPEVWHRWYQRDAIPAYSQFLAEMELESSRGLVIEAISTGEIAGWVSHYKDDPVSRYIYADVAVFPQYFSTGLGIEAFGLWVNFLFERRNVRKVYIEAVDYTVHSYDDAVQRYFRLEGTFHDHEYFAGRYWDHYTFAVYRDDFMQQVQPRLYAFIRRARDRAANRSAPSLQ